MFCSPVVRHLNNEIVYEPSEDTFLFLDCFELEKKHLDDMFKNTVPLIVEIGVGSGSITSFVQKYILSKSIFIGTDINPYACKTMLKTISLNNEKDGKPVLIDSCQMNLTSSLRNNQTNILIFNPPYVPTSTIPNIKNIKIDSDWLKFSYCGGDNGMTITWKVLNNLEKILDKNLGVAYILFCARNKPNDVAKYMEKKNWNVVNVITKKIGSEILTILKFNKKHNI